VLDDHEFGNYLAKSIVQLNDDLQGTLMVLNSELFLQWIWNALSRSFQGLTTYHRVVPRTTRPAAPVTIPWDAGVTVGSRWGDGGVTVG
jgi:hypothetical protein